MDTPVGRKPAGRTAIFVISIVSLLFTAYIEPAAARGVLAKLAELAAGVGVGIAGNGGFNLLRHRVCTDPQLMAKVDDDVRKALDCSGLSAK